MPVLSQLLVAGRSENGKRESVALLPPTPPPHTAEALHEKAGESSDGSGSSPRPNPLPGPGPASHSSPTGPALRANPSPEVTDRFCRLPLPTLFYRLEAFHLGDLLRIWVRPGTRLGYHSLGFSRADESAPDTARAAVLYGLERPSLRSRRFQGVRSLQRKENSSRSPRQRLLVRLRYRSRPRAFRPPEDERSSRGLFSVSRFGNIDPIPFRGSRLYF